MKQILSHNSPVMVAVVTILTMAVFFISLISCAAYRPVAVQQRPSPALAQLKMKIDSILADSALLSTRVGIKVVSLSNGEVLYSRNEKELFHPASNMKLLTTATALQVLGPAYQFPTILYADSASLQDSVINGPIYLKGYGNPDLTTADLRKMAEELKLLGIREIHGDLICDETYFDDLYWGKGWMWDDASSWYFASISALSVNDNCVEVIVQPGKQPGEPLQVQLRPPTDYLQIENRGLTVAPEDSARLAAFKIERKWKTRENVVVIQGGLPPDSPARSELVDVLEPALYAGHLFRDLLQEVGIQLIGTVQKDTTDDRAVPVVIHRSLPLTITTYFTNKISDNLSAEMLLKAIGAEKFGPPGTAAKGIAALNEYLFSIGVDTTRIELADGSGVSRYNLITPDLLVGLLMAMYQDFAVQAEYLASLPIAGVDGSLQRRMQNGPAMGILRAKTGTLSGVSALSGYTRTQDGEILAFSILMEHFVGNSTRIRAIQDRIGEVLSQFSRKQITRLTKKNDQQE